MRRVALLVVAAGLAAAAPAVAAPIPTQDSARATGDAPNQSGSGGFFDIDVSATSGPSGESPSGHAAFSLGSPGGLAVAGPVTCLQVGGNVAYLAFDDGRPGFGPVSVRLVDGGVAGSSLDRFDSFLSVGGAHCGFSPVLPENPVVGGDVEVIDASPLPTAKDQCKGAGWLAFGGLFRNQGQCVAFVARGAKS